MDRINAMNAFVRVIEAGSFTKAAQTMNVPKPTVTRLVQSLEAQMRVQLINRNSRALALTPEGASYYERISRLLAELEEIETDARGSLARPSGRIKVELSIALANVVIVPALSEFYASYPDIDVEMSIGNRDADVIADGIDCAIRTGPIADESLVARRIGFLHFITCAAPNYLTKFGRPTHPEELLKNHRTIGMFSTRIGRALPFAFSNGSQRLEIDPRHILTVNDTNSYLAAGTAGLGIVQAPRISVEKSIATGKLVPLIEDWQSDIHPMSIVYPPNRFLSAKVRVFVDWLIGLFERHPTFARTLQRASGP